MRVPSPKTMRDRISPSINIRSAVTDSVASEDIVRQPVCASGTGSVPPISKSVPVDLFSSDDFNADFTAWEKRNFRALLAYAFTQTRDHSRISERKKDSEDIFSTAKGYFYRTRLIPTPRLAREKIRFIAHDKYRKKEFEPGNEQCPVSGLGFTGPVDGAARVGDEEVFSNRAIAGWSWIQQTFANPAEAVADSELRKLVIAAIEALPEEHARPVYLQYFSDLEVAEIASQLRVPESTIKGRLVRARRALKRKLERLLD